MKTLLKSLERYGIGSRALTEEDFFLICEKEDIEILYSSEKFSFYFSMLGQHFIVLPKRRKGLRWLFTAFHELAHALASHARHEPRAAFHGIESQHHDKNEAEADAIALVAMMPKSELIGNAFFDDSRYGGKLYNERLRLYFLYGI